MQIGKVVLFFVMVWFLGVLLGWTYDGAAMWGIGHSQTLEASMETLSGAAVSQQTLPLVGNVGFLTPVTGFFKTLFDALTWKFSFTEPYPIVNYMLRAFGIAGTVTMFTVLWGSISGNITWG
jgi:hypothetical protein